jgi:hypothetical protein
MDDENGMLESFTFQSEDKGMLFVRYCRVIALSKMENLYFIISGGRQAIKPQKSFAGSYGCGILNFANTCLEPAMWFKQS